MSIYLQGNLWITTTNAGDQHFKDRIGNWHGGALVPNLEESHSPVVDFLTEYGFEHVVSDLDDDMTVHTMFFDGMWNNQVETAVEYVIELGIGVTGSLFEQDPETAEPVSDPYIEFDEAYREDE